MKTKEEIKKELERELIVRLFKERMEEHNQSWNGCANSIIDEAKDLTPNEFISTSEHGDIILKFFYLERDIKGFPSLEKLKLVEIECIELILSLTERFFKSKVWHSPIKNGIKVLKQYVKGKAIKSKLEDARYWLWQHYKEMQCGGDWEHDHELYEFVFMNTLITITDIDNYKYNNGIIGRVEDIAKESPFISRKKVMKECANICRKHLKIPENYLIC